MIFKCNSCNSKAQGNQARDKVICPVCNLIMVPELKSKITFELETPGLVKIMREGKQIGQVWSELPSGTTPYPHNESIPCLNSIQICGFDKMSEIWACGPFHGKKDCVVSFTPVSELMEYMERKTKSYLNYVQGKVNKKDSDIQNFTDWSAHNV
jgi:DNA-directed RNA polymerase subunit RPC12/RpoP